MFSSRILIIMETVAASTTPGLLEIILFLFACEMERAILM